MFAFVHETQEGTAYMDNSKQKNILNGKKHIHFIGIGGSGMYPLAQILHGLGYCLTGSDNNETETLDAVRALGIPVYSGQRAENIEGADLIVHTAAIIPLPSPLHDLYGNERQKIPAKFLKFPLVITIFFKDSKFSFHFCNIFTFMVDR